MMVLCLSAALAGASIGTIALRAQSDEGKRRVKYLGKPQYPDLAKQMRLAGTVKIAVTVAPDGKVKHAQVIGGNPVLAVEAEKVATQCEFEAGPKETNEILEFKFSP